jgi:hypothetical protein
MKKNPPFNYAILFSMSLYFILISLHKENIKHFFKFFKLFTLLKTILFLLDETAKKENEIHSTLRDRSLFQRNCKSFQLF